jgi:hypothetical protein
MLADVLASAHYDAMMDAPADLLPPGLQLRKRGEGLETASSRAGALQLLVAHPRLEIVRGALKKGERMFLVPPEDARQPTVEVCYVLEGYFQYGEALTVGPGDYAVAEALTEPVSLMAVSDVSFLYLTSRPFFHEISETLTELMHLAVEVEAKDGSTACASSGSPTPPGRSWGWSRTGSICSTTVPTCTIWARLGFPWKFCRSPPR